MMTQNKGPNLIEAKLLNFQNFVAIARVLKIYEMVLSIQLFGFVSLLKTHEKPRGLKTTEQFKQNVYKDLQRYT
jgi:hypothetical protein